MNMLHSNGTVLGHHLMTNVKYEYWSKNTWDLFKNYGLEPEISKG